MAVLVSPGTSIEIINESFYGSAGAGTVPLFVIATESSKADVGGTGIAPGTVPSQAESLFLATSQRELALRFGAPKFYSVNGTPLHGHELNEYGLHAAYSFLGGSNRAYVLRADLDLGALEPSSAAPRGVPAAGTHWFDLTDSTFGLFSSNGDTVAGKAWDSKTVLVTTSDDVDVNFKPLDAYGANGNYAIVPQANTNAFYEKIGGVWFKINNSTGTTSWRAQRAAVILSKVNPSTFPANNSTITIVSGALSAYTVTFSSPGSLADVASQINAASTGKNITATVVSNQLIIKQTTGEDIVLTGVSGAFTPLEITAGTYKSSRAYFTNSAQYPQPGPVAKSVWIKLSSPNAGAVWKVRRYDSGTGQWANVTVPFYYYDSSLADTSTAKDAQVRLAVPSPAIGFIYAGIDPAANVGDIELRRWSGTKYEALTYTASLTAPTTSPVDGTLWYSSNFRADIMVNQAGTDWVGYQIAYPDTDPNGIIIAGSAPEFQSDGTTALVDNDLWLDASDLENYPRIYRWSVSAARWSLVDTTDQTTPFGVLFADARQDTGPTGVASSTHSIARSEAVDQMVLSNMLDPDAPDARSYPEGMLLFNTRYSTYNVKVWRPLHFVEGGFDDNINFGFDAYSISGNAFPALGTGQTGRWVTASGNNVNGSPYMGRKAQRVMVVRALAEAINANEDIRSEAVYFNLIATPGYPELIDEMVALNTDAKEVAFVVADTPARLNPNATSVQSWAANMKNASGNGEDGLVSGSPYVGVYYPWGMSSNLDGSDVMVPPSTIAMRTLAYNDQVAYPWFAPAGFQRGLVTNAASVGYLTAENEYRSVMLNQGQRDVLYSNRVNPITFLTGRGLVVFGQKTLDASSSALDRVNVARLVNYLRYRLDSLVKPFLFEQNDNQTRDAARVTVERFLLGLVGLRAIEDFIVLCDDSNNTPERRDRNELWIDILVKPLKSVEFIFVPVRIRNSGDDLSI